MFIRAGDYRESKGISLRIQPDISACSLFRSLAAVSEFAVRGHMLTTIDVETCATARYERSRGPLAKSKSI